ncbi:DNA gyrase C-terminal beta-propeller domain-containing protein [Leptolyngbya sp. 7M]|uniref:DNA gyrase C-terminal beta-propeller domain-containing protein n=1 Tax=Leptolyngbya sp. 7M TaxID=2812896 RepID=UPI001B8B29D0|nr:DNA gyrase C-terminal beta-propeller domain-containing protein [Leptolyngbya sp. 7M]QYO63762.1 hypothetical protein JVX88_28580 [Leptolyngbya sp. 7M]
MIAISLEEGDQLRWVRLARVEDSIIIGSRLGMAIHFRATDEQLRPLGRPTRGVKAMALKKSDELISMDILPSQVVASIAEGDEADADSESEELEAECNTQGPWALVITMGGLGKRVPITQFRLQNRAGMGLRSIKFRKANDRLASLRIVNEDDEIILVTSRGIIIRQAVKAISCQSRAATGVRVQKLDDDDAIVAVALVPPTAESAEGVDVEE